MGSRLPCASASMTACLMVESGASTFVPLFWSPSTARNSLFGGMTAPCASCGISLYTGALPSNALDTEWTKLVPENTTIGVDEENTVMVSSSGGESVQEKAQEISEEKTHGHELKVGNTYFHGSVVISQLDEKPGKLKIVFKIDDERLEALTSLHSRSRAKSDTWCSSKRRTPTQ